MLKRTDSISDLQKITARIQLANGDQGTAVLYASKSNPESVYVITASHCLSGKDFLNNPKPEDIKLEVPSKLGNGFYNEFKLPGDSKICFSKEKLTDIGFIIIKRSDLELLTGEIPVINLIDCNQHPVDVTFMGFPIVFDDSYSRPINGNVAQQVGSEIEIVPDGILQSDNYIIQDTFQGLSGSGIFFLRPNSIPGLLGVLYKVGEWPRFYGINISELNILLSQNALEEETISIIEPNNEIFESISVLNQNTSDILNNVRDKIGDLHLDRKQLLNGSKSSLDQNRVVLITGSAGGGKSAFVKNLLTDVTTEKTTKVIAFKAEQINKPGLIEVLASLQVNSTFEEILNSPLLGNRKIIWIDGIEKSLESKNLSVVRMLFKLANERQDLCLLLTIRSYSLEQFRINFFLEFPPTTRVITILPLDENEMQEVISKYPHIKDFYQNPKIRKLLEQPFYLDNSLKITNYKIDSQTSISEKEFKDALWVNIIENGNPERGSIFEQIVLKRIKEGSHDTEPQRFDGELIELVGDNLLIERIDGTIHKYSPAHDIFEDLALVRYVARIFSNESSAEKFFISLGEEYAIRRGFRFWLQGELEELNSNIKDFILSSLVQVNIPQHWKDEIIVAILQSSYCQSFFRDQEKELLKDGAKLLVRFIHLLRVACREPIPSILSQEGENRFRLYSALFQPKGLGWEAMIVFFNDHFLELESSYKLILSVLFDWSNQWGMDIKAPPKAKEAGSIILNFLKAYQIDEPMDGQFMPTGENLKKSINLLFSITEVLQEEVSELIEEAISKLQDIEKLKYWARDYYEEIIEQVLSFVSSRSVCRYLPDLVIKCANWKWKLNTNDENKYRDYYSREIEFDFGLAHDYKLGYFPASAYQTPLWHLFVFHPEKAILFLIDFINYSTEFYIKSEFAKGDNATEVAVKLNDGTVVKQCGSFVLWCMYRGTGKATPYLLQSLLMALEKWLLQLASYDDNTITESLNIFFTEILKDGKSVALTSVLSSVSIAYPQIFKENIASLFTVKEFFNWDIQRWIGDKTGSLAWNDSSGKNPYVQNERQEANSLIHRKKYTLESFFIQWIIKQSDKTRGFEILDGHYEALINEPDDPHWRLAINRMDIRKFEVQELSDDGRTFFLMPKIDDDLLSIVEEGKTKSDEDLPVMTGSNWAHNVFKDKMFAENTLENWETYFSICKESFEHGRFGLYSYNSVGTIAAIGIRDYLGKLTEDQKEWCVQRVLEISKSIIEKEGNHYSIDTVNNPFDRDPTMSILPYLLKQEFSEGIKKEARRLIFRALLELRRDNGLDEPILKSLGETIWVTEIDFANACFRGLIKIGSLIEPKGPYDPYAEETEERKRHETSKEDIIREVVNVTISEPEWESIAYTRFASFYFDKAFDLLPENLPLFDEHVKFSSKYIDLLFVEANTRDDRGFHHRSEKNYMAASYFQQKIGRLFLLQQREVIIPLFEKMLDFGFSNFKIGKLTNEAFEIINDSLKQIIYTEDKLQKIDSFWILWRHLFKRMKEENSTIFLGRLLLNIPWKLEARDWETLNNEKAYYKEVINTFGKLNLVNVVTLLGGIGFQTLLPDGITWFAELAKNRNNLEWTTSFGAEKLIQRCYYLFNDEFKKDKKLKSDFIFILDKMVEAGSSLAFYIREDVI